MEYDLHTCVPVWVPWDLMCFFLVLKGSCKKEFFEMNLTFCSTSLPDIYVFPYISPLDILRSWKIEDSTNNCIVLANLANVGVLLINIGSQYILPNKYIPYVVLEQYIMGRVSSICNMCSNSLHTFCQP